MYSYAVTLQFPLQLRGPNKFQHDNSPVFKASSVKTWRAKFGVKELECAAQSPDFNPTTYKHLWDKLHLRPRYPASS